jgi:hypothetical protein
MPRAAKAIRLQRFNDLRQDALRVGLDLRVCQTGALEGFNEVFDPQTGQALTSGVGVYFWLQGYAEALERKATS